MNILICGASGFVGSHLARSLQQAGHQVLRGVRNPRSSHDIHIDYTRDTTPEAWLPRLKTCSVVINAVGALRNTPGSPLQKLHDEAPSALFSAAAASGIRHLVQISALGVGRGLNTPYFSTKLHAEARLQGLPASVKWLCLRPSVIFGQGGSSTRLFLTLAKLPVHMLPAGGKSLLQPVHIDDIAQAVLIWINNEPSSSLTLDAVGAEATTLAGMLDAYRHQMGFSPALHVSIPALLTRMAARCGDFIPASPLCSDTLNMLLLDNTSPADPFTNHLGHLPRSFRQFI
ncbi:MAG: NAD(P)H-binding protein, partial [Pseudomonadota bacterium]|nr:NAD(P)H-binding protein [Pseudomonadota bacterium]